MTNYIKIVNEKYVYYVNAASIADVSVKDIIIKAGLTIQLASVSDYIIERNGESKIIKNRHGLEEEIMLDTQLNIVAAMSIEEQSDNGIIQLSQATM